MIREMIDFFIGTWLWFGADANNSRLSSMLPVAGCMRMPFVLYAPSAQRKPHLPIDP
jgi:hypothetical protein